jgi:hypothetical protein
LANVNGDRRKELGDTVVSAADLAAELPRSARRHAEAVSHNSALPLVWSA